jgi:hypothetical protein
MPNAGLLISGSKVRVLDGPPIETGTSERTPRCPFCACRRHVDGRRPINVIQGYFKIVIYLGSIWP